jgi:hypothetical protein
MFGNIKTQIIVYVGLIETAGLSKAALSCFSRGRIYVR